MTETPLGRSGDSAGEADENAPLPRIDAAVFEALSLRRRADAEGESPPILRWFAAWAGSGE